MIVYICDFCEEAIPYGADRYLIKTVNANRKQIPAITTCLCSKCKASWESRIPALFAFDGDDGED